MPFRFNAVWARGELGEGSAPLDHKGDIFDGGCDYYSECDDDSDDDDDHVTFGGQVQAASLTNSGMAAPTPACTGIHSTLRTESALALSGIAIARRERDLENSTRTSCTHLGAKLHCGRCRSCRSGPPVRGVQRLVLGPWRLGLPFLCP